MLHKCQGVSDRSGGGSGAPAGGNDAALLTLLDGYPPDEQAPLTPENVDAWLQRGSKFALLDSLMREVVNLALYTLLTDTVRRRLVINVICLWLVANALV